MNNTRKRISMEEKEIIKTMRDSNKGYAEIAKALNCKTSRVKAYCNVNSLGGRRAANYNEDPARDFIKEFNNRFGNRFKYISGYKNCKSYIILSCKICNEEFERRGTFITANKNVRCPHCHKAEKIIREQNSQEEKNKKESLIRISKMKEQIERDLKELERMKKCGDCNNLFKAKKVTSVRCEFCLRRHNNRYKELRKRKLRENGKVDYSISLEKLIRKEKNVCYLCGGHCNLNDTYTDDKGSFIVGPNYPSIDHVQPVSKGGTHTRDNVKLTHHYCNTIKNNHELDSSKEESLSGIY